MQEQEYYDFLQSFTAPEIPGIDGFDYPVGTISDFKYHFTYLASYDVLKSRFNLEKIAGQGKTINRALNIMDWMTRETYYCGRSRLGGSDSLTILAFSYEKGFDGAINCENKAILLSDLLLALDICACPVVLESYALENGHMTGINCHVVVHVYLTEEDRWIMLDPSFNAFFTDKAGKILNIMDIKYLLKNQEQPCLARYSLNGQSEIFRQRYFNQFIRGSSMCISPWNVNSPDERNGKRNVLFPAGLDYLDYFEKQLRLNGFAEERICDLCGRVRLISVGEFLAEPVFSKGG